LACKASADFITLMVVKDKNARFSCLQKIPEERRYISLSRLKLRLSVRTSVVIQTCMLCIMNSKQCTTVGDVCSKSEIRLPSLQLMFVFIEDKMGELNYGRGTERTTRMQHS
jgi:hypothetical protein